jgi:hypothetical protein
MNTLAVRPHWRFWPAVFLAGYDRGWNNEERKEERIQRSNEVAIFLWSLPVHSARIGINILPA